MSRFLWFTVYTSPQATGFNHKVTASFCLVECDSADSFNASLWLCNLNSKKMLKAHSSMSLGSFQINQIKKLISCFSVTTVKQIMTITKVNY